MVEFISGQLYLRKAPENCHKCPYLHYTETLKGTSLSYCAVMTNPGSDAPACKEGVVFCKAAITELLNRKRKEYTETIDSYVDRVKSIDLKLAKLNEQVQRIV